jgi:hypothetical protein
MAEARNREQYERRAQWRALASTCIAVARLHEKVGQHQYALEKLVEARVNLRRAQGLLP